jgi:hypothetical protein
MPLSTFHCLHYTLGFVYSVTGSANSLAMYLPAKFRRMCPKLESILVHILGTERNNLDKVIARQLKGLHDAASAAKLPPGSPKKPSPPNSLKNPSLDPGKVISGGIQKNRQTRRRVTYPKPKGMYNPLAWCYRRALTPCLLHTPAFCKFLIAEHETCAPHRCADCVFCAARNLEVDYWYKSANPDIAASALDNVIGRHIPTNDLRREFKRTSKQCVPHEFFVGLLNLLKSSLDTRG